METVTVTARPPKDRLTHPDAATLLVELAKQEALRQGTDLGLTTINAVREQSHTDEGDVMTIVFEVDLS